MMRPDQVEQSKFTLEQNSQFKKNNLDEGMHSHNASTIHDHSIYVDMPQGISAKNSARTGYHFYKNSSNQNSAQKNPMVRGGGF